MIEQGSGDRGLEQNRFYRAMIASSRYPGIDSKEIFIRQQVITQQALQEVGASSTSSPSVVEAVDKFYMRPDMLMSLRIPYAVEVLGMPFTGKTTMIDRYLAELWGEDKRDWVVNVSEGARSIKDKYGYLRYSDPFTYSTIAGTVTFAEYINQSVLSASANMRMVVADRGQIDRGVFRRTLFNQGRVNPDVMVDENSYKFTMENTPMQVGAVIMLMARPEVTMKRSKDIGPVINPIFLPQLYEQYWRLHGELLRGEIPYRIYTCINAEADIESVYERFKFAMDSTLSLPETLTVAFSKAFPREYDEMLSRVRRGERYIGPKQRAWEEKLKARIRVVGGDEMEDTEEAFDKPIIEVYRMRKRGGVYGKGGRKKDQGNIVKVESFSEKNWEKFTGKRFPHVRNLNVGDMLGCRTILIITYDSDDPNYIKGATLSWVNGEGRSIREIDYTQTYDWDSKIHDYQAYIPRELREYDIKEKGVFCKKWILSRTGARIRVEEDMLPISS